MSVLRGKVWLFGDSISTEYMMPGHVMLAKMPDDEAKLHCMSAIRPGFAGMVMPGDVVVAGENFGCGSSRLGSRMLSALGISCVIAESFAGIFYRNGINAGLPLIELPGIRQRFAEGDSCAVDLMAGTIANLSRGEVMAYPPFPPEVLRILSEGGIIPLLKREMQEQRQLPAAGGM